MLPAPSSMVQPCPRYRRKSAWQAGQSSFGRCRHRRSPPPVRPPRAREGGIGRRNSCRHLCPEHEDHSRSLLQHRCGGLSARFGNIKPLSREAPPRGLMPRLPAMHRHVAMVAMPWGKSGTLWDETASIRRLGPTRSDRPPPCFRYRRRPNSLEGMIGQTRPEGALGLRPSLLLA